MCALILATLLAFSELRRLVRFLGVRCSVGLGLYLSMASARSSVFSNALDIGPKASAMILKSASTYRLCLIALRQLLIQAWQSRSSNFAAERLVTYIISLCISYFLL